MKPDSLFYVIIVFIFFVSTKAFAQAEKIITPVSVPNTELRSLYSNILEQELELYVKLPPGYYNDPRKLYPSWYFTDGNRNFPMLANIVSIFDIPRPSEPEVIVIGIAYRIKDMGDWGAWRTRDLTPSNIPALDSSWVKTLSEMTGRQYDIRSGGSKQFLECIEKEIIPFIESNYRIMKSYRGLGGYSYGGLFSLYVLFTRPEIFSIYYAGSPSIGFDKGIIFNLEDKYSSMNNDLNAKVFISSGEKEGLSMTGNIEKLADLLESRHYPGLSVTTCVFQDETHLSCMPASIMRAFRILYNKP